MLAFLWIAGTGWIAIFFLACASMLPFALRWIRPGNAAQIGGMRVHYVLGFAIPAFAMLHSLSTMSRLQNISATGIWLATFALVALVAQVMLGTELRAPPWGQPRALRRWHLLIMIAATGLIAGHVVLDHV
ncbi:MAG TPA: hypothetical protein VMU22_08025 [Rhizomicrobium sp.]|nr:hypothetical protein [Rhizomicrobium sp.]